MKFISKVLTFSTYIATVAVVSSSTPVEDRELTLQKAREPTNDSLVDVHDLEKRTPGGVYICDQLNWQGRCGYQVQPLEECIELGSDWNKQISSFGPDPCTFCDAYDTPKCQKTSQIWSFGYPGDATGDYGGKGAYWDNQISSFMCWYEVEWC